MRLSLINPEAVTESLAATYEVREAARGVVVDADGLIALLWVGKHGYAKLPGGGLENGDDAEQAFYRECLEEIGCQVTITQQLGIVEC